MRRLIGIVFVLLMCYGASAQTEVIESKLGKDASKSVNKDSTFTLYKAVKDNESGVPVLKYIVQRNGDKRIILEGSITMGVVDWSADYELEEGKSLGTAQSGIANKRKIDLRPYLQKP